MLDLWQFKLCQTLCSTDSAATSKMGERSQENIGSVMSPEYLHSVEMSLLSRSEARGTEELDQLLGQYIKGDQTKIMSPEAAELLATVLLLHDIPSKHIIQLGSNSKYLKCIVTACGYICIDAMASNTARPVPTTKITRSISYSSHKALTIATTLTSILFLSLIVIQKRYMHVHMYVCICTVTVNCLKTPCFSWLTILCIIQEGTVIDAV